MLVDTSVWVDHLRRRNTLLVQLLEQEQVWTHPFVIGELACGNLARRSSVLSSLSELPHLPTVDHAEVLMFVEAQRLMGRGLGWIDMHLLAAARLAKLPFWTVDKRLASVANELGLGTGCSDARSRSIELGCSRSAKAGDAGLDQL
jgi:predicted nucleic acid-binding protein